MPKKTTRQNKSRSPVGPLEYASAPAVWLPRVLFSKIASDDHIWFDQARLPRDLQLNSLAPVVVDGDAIQA